METDDDDQTPDGSSARDRKPSPSALIRLNSENVKTWEKFQVNEESLSKLFDVIDWKIF
jgi:hypothetical protein